MYLSIAVARSIQIIEKCVSAVGVSTSIELRVILLAQFFVVFFCDLALLGLIGLEEIPDGAAVSRCLHFLLRGVRLLEGLLHLLLHVRTNK